MPKSKKILLYVHFNKHSQLADYVIQQLHDLRPLFHKVVFISNSQISKQDIEKIEGLYDDFIQRQNIGFDFAAWRDGIKKIGWEELGKYDSVTMMNDTCFGPIHPLSPMYQKMGSSNADFWGLTNHEAACTPHNKFIPEHIQSYFVCYNKNVVKSKPFQTFWENVKDYKTVGKVIQNYETQITGVLTANNFSYSAVFDVPKYSATHNIIEAANFSELCPLILIDANMPFIKIKSFTHLPYKQIIKAIQKTSNYPTHLVYDHLKTMKIPILNQTTYRIIKVKTRTSKTIKNNKTLNNFAHRHPKIIQSTKKVSKLLFGDSYVYSAPKTSPNSTAKSNLQTPPDAPPPTSKPTR